MDSKLFGKIVQRVEAVAGVKALLVLPVTALYFSIVSGCIRADEFVADTQLSSSGFKQSGQIPLTVGESVGELKAVIRLDAFNPDMLSCIPLEQLVEEVGGGIGGLFGVGSKETEACELVNGCVLEQAELRVCHTFAGYYLHIHLDPLAWIGHLLIRFWFIGRFVLCRREQAQLTHNPE